MKFLSLFQYDPAVPPGEAQMCAGRFFPAVLAKSKLHAWKPGQPIVASGKRILLGVAASYSLYDLALLDLLNEAADLPVRVDVFDCTLQATPEADRDKYIPGMSSWVTTPVIGIWEDGQLVLSGSHRTAFQVAAELLGIGSADELVCRLRQRAAERATT